MFLSRIKKAVDYCKSGKTKRLSSSSVSTRFRFVTSIQQLHEFEKQIESHGPRNDKLNEIWAYTFQEFINANDNKFVIQRGAILILKISLHLLHDYGNSKAIIGLFQEKFPDSLQVITQEKKFDIIRSDDLSIYSKIFM